MKLARKSVAKQTIAQLVVNQRQRNRKIAETLVFVSTGH